MSAINLLKKIAPRAAGSFVSEKDAEDWLESHINSLQSKMHSFRWQLIESGIDPDEKFCAKRA